MDRNEILNQVRIYFWKYYKSNINFDIEKLPDDFQIESVGRHRIDYLLNNKHDLFRRYVDCNAIARGVYAEYYSG